ncbi:MAG: hypothetical protein COZ80_04690, partial [Ignavibacteria bacterium CG_4_8_14_3_um_filter_37_9]
MGTKNIWFFCLVFSTFTFSQNLSVNPKHPVYDFLNQLRIKNILSWYDDAILPLTRGEVFIQLQKAKDSTAMMSENDKGRLHLFLQFFPSSRKSNNSFFYNNSYGLGEHFFSWKENYAYSYQDSLLSFSIAPLVTTKNIFLKKTAEQLHSAFLITYGGAFSLEYGDWFAAYLEVWNGYQGGDKKASMTDQRVRQSFSVNHTGINYFDQTTGYVTLKKDIFKLQIGRERILWG